MRIALGIEYNGSHYCGWQRQKNAESVQQKVEKAITKVADSVTIVQAACRTDTAVHATEQVVHFDCENERELKAWVLGVNANLPNSITVLWEKAVASEFSARFSAQSRRYRYIIFNRKTRPALLDKLVTWQRTELDLAAMQYAAKQLVGKHDYTSYRAVACQANSPVRTVHEINIAKQGPFIFLDIHADGFLHHMVRNITGVLMTIGKKEQAKDWAFEVLQKRDRTLGGVTAPPNGLYLVKVHYDEIHKLDQKIRWPTISMFE